MKSAIKGKNILFRLIEVADASFVLDLRKSPRGRFLSDIDDDVKKQEEWISNYKIREKNNEEFYFIIEHESAGKVGALRLYDFKNDSFCWGSWIVKEGAPSMTALESALLVYEFGFFHLKFVRSHFAVRKDNQKIIAFHQRFGAKITGEDDVTSYFEITREEYEKTKNRLSKKF